MVVSNGSVHLHHRQMGLVQEVFGSDTLDRLHGDMAIGHVRYSTAGDSHVRNAQPFAVQTGRGPLAVAHNGTLTNAHRLRHDLEKAGSIFHSNSDTECLVHLIARSDRARFLDRLLEAVSSIEGAYSLVFMNGSQIVAVRDPHGFRPLCMGRLGSSPVVSSESCAFDLIGGTLQRELKPGEVVVLSRGEGRGSKAVRSLFPMGRGEPRLCIFEFIYFARPNSIIEGRSVYEARIDMGRRLAVEHPADADMVMPIPDSGTPAAIGFSRESGIPFELGLIRSHYVGRTFIEPKSSIRHFGVKLKLSPVRSLIKGKRVVIIDDSIVRGTTSRKIVGMLREAGARQVHLRIASPPTCHPCYYGIDTPTRRELIASSCTVPEIASYLEVDSLGYLSLEGSRAAAESGTGGWCDACFSGDYPVPIPDVSEHQQTSLL